MKPPQLRWLIFLLTLLWIGMSGLHGQAPAHFVFGLEELKGLRIYDLKQSRGDNYLISTNEGLYLYDFHRFNPVECANTRSQSMFNLVADNSGNIYFHNIDNQIFVFDGEKCRLFYELSQKDASFDISIKLGKHGELFILCRNTIVLNRHGKLLHRAEITLNPWGNPLPVNNFDLLFHQAYSDSAWLWRDGSFRLQMLTGIDKEKLGGTAFNFVEWGGQHYGYSAGTRQAYEINRDDFSLREIETGQELPQVRVARLYQAGGKTWVAGPVPGVNAISGAPPNLKVERLFDEFVISQVYEDMEGNVLFGTFDNGILVAPDPDLKDHSIKTPGENVLDIEKNPLGPGFLMSTSKGRLLKFMNGVLEEVIPEGLQSAEVILHQEGGRFVMVDNGSFFMLTEDGISKAGRHGASVKQLGIMDDGTVLLGTNRGLIRMIPSGNSGQVFLPVPGFDFRFHSIQVVKGQGMAYASTSNGLISIDSLLNWKPVTILGQEVYPSAITLHGDTLYAALPTEGALKVLGGKIIGFDRPDLALRETVTKIVVNDWGVWVRASHYLILFDHNGLVLRDFSQEFGLAGSRIFDFLQFGDSIWVSHGGGTQAYDLNKKTANIPVPEVRIKEVWVNDRKVPYPGAGDFNSDERKVSIQLVIPSLRAMHFTGILFRLGPGEKEWTYHDDATQAIVFNSLSPGKYLFEAKAVMNGRTGSVVRYEFYIASPWYASLWFWLCAILILGLIIFSTFRRLIAAHERKIRFQNELNSSKLTAIQSQMNPHFIFNSLNSIQDLILKGETEKSYSFVTTFSNLVRSALKFSERDFISLEEEVNMLKLYLSLEQLRFKHDLSYTIEGDTEESVLVPPFIIQPFVENALLHGLLHKQGHKKLTISLKLEESLICVIEDNGIGRKEAGEIRKRQMGGHESFAGKAIRKRLDIFAEVYHGQFGYEFEDLEQDGQPTGTRITLKIPIKRRF